MAVTLKDESEESGDIINRWCSPGGEPLFTLNCVPYKRKSKVFYDTSLKWTFYLLSNTF